MTYNIPVNLFKQMSNTMRQIRNIGLLFLVLNIIVLSQQERDTQNFLSNKSLMNTKSLQEYYQNVFKTSQPAEQTGVAPAFDVNKEEILAKMKEAIPLQGPVEPENYSVGPGDLFSIDIWTNVPMNFVVPVTPEGSLIIPSVGSIEVKNLTLAQLKKKVKQELRKDFIKGDITVTLLSPRIFIVNVSGVVNNPGMYYASATQRVDAAVYQANLTSKLQQTSIDKFNPQEQRDLLNRSDVITYFGNYKLTEEPLKISLRNIKIIRNNNEDTLTVDLIRYYATGNTKYNPFLQDGDRIIVPNLNLRGNSITISGAVRLEGTYEFLKGDSLSSVFEIAQGPQALADLEHIDLYRMNPENGQVKHLVVNFKNIKNGKESDIELMPNDRIVVREIYPRPLPLSVKIKGAVKKPGLYPILKNKTTLSEVINKAGGFLPEASLAEAKIIRTRGVLDAALENPDYERLVQMRLSDMDKEQREYFNFEAAIKRKTVSVNFKKLFMDNDKTQDIFLEDGDIILIPAKSNTVFVYGQVAQPGYLNYKPEADYEYYLEEAGGTTEMADECEIRVIKAGTNLWLDPDDTELEPGDAIWVPRVKERDFAYYFDWFSKVISVAGGVATIYLLLQK